MAGGHSHSHDHADLDAKVPVDPRARIVLIAVLGAAFVATVLGVVHLWPEGKPQVDDASNAFAAPGVTFPKARVESLQKPCPQNGEGQSGNQAPTCGQGKVTVLSGPEKGKQVLVPLSPDVLASGLRRGDTLEVMRNPTTAGQTPSYAFFSVQRDAPIAILTILFVLVVGAVARLRGLLALVGLGFGAAVLVYYMLPALLEGRSGLGVAVTGSAVIMFVVLYLAHGLSVRTSSALLGTLAAWA